MASTLPVEGEWLEHKDEASRPDVQGRGVRQVGLHAAVFLAAVLFVAAVFSVLIWLGYRAAQHQAEDNAKNISLVLVNNVEAILSRAEGDMRGFSVQISDSDLKGDSSDDRRRKINEIINSHVSSFKFVESYRVFDADGRFVLGAEKFGDSSGLFVGDRDWFNRLKNDVDRRIVISDLLVGRATNQPIIILAIPLRSADGRFRGAINAGINVGALQDLLSQVRLGAAGLVNVRNLDSYKLLLRQPILDNMVEKASLGEEYDRTRFGTSEFGYGELVSPVDNIARRYAFRTVPNYGLRVLVALADQDYLGTWRRQSWGLFTVGLFIIVCISLLYFVQMMIQSRIVALNARLQSSKERLRQEASRLENILRTSSDGIHILDAHGYLTLASDSFYAMHGLRPDPDQELHVSDWNAQWSRESFTDRLARQVLEGALEQFETLHRRADGSVFDVEVSTRGILIDGEACIFCSARDIHARKATEAALRESEERYRNAFEQAAVGIVHTDFDGRFIDCNLRFVDIIGYSKDELLLLNFKTISYPEDMPISQRALAPLLSGQQTSVAWEGRYIQKSGNLTWVRLTTSILSDQHGENHRYITIVEDINSRKAVEQDLDRTIADLNRSEERLRSLIEETTDWLWEMDANYCFTWFSPSFSDVLGRSSDYFIGKRRWDMASDESEVDVNLWRQHMDDLAYHRPFRDFRYWIVTEKQTSKWVSINGAPVYDESGVFVGYRGTGTDVTQEALMAQRLHMLSTVIEQSPISVVITDPQGVIEYVNHQYTVTYGFSSAEAVGNTPRMHTSKVTPRDVHVEMWATIQAGKQWSGEVRNRRKDGELCWASLIISPILDEVGHITHYAAVMDDTTEERELRERLFRTNAELEQFAYAASHDLRQPLRMVMSYLTLIERRLGEQMNDENKSFFHFAIDGAKRMDRLIVDLLEYSRTNRSSTVETVSLGDVIDSSLLNLTVLIDANHAEISVPDALPVVTGNPSELVRLFQNLIGNAIKYHAKDRNPKIEIGWHKEASHYLIWVKDNGIGIAKADCERAFKVFQRLVPNDQYDGTGIGLAICKKIVESLGGTIWIESEVGVGSTFFLTISL